MQAFSKSCDRAGRGRTLRTHDEAMRPDMKPPLQEMLMDAWIIVGLMIFVFYFVIKAFSGSVPQISKGEIENFKETLPKEFHDYVYCLDRTGIAFDVASNRIFLMQDAQKKIYALSEIREVNYAWQGATQWWSKGGGLVKGTVSKINVALDNRIERKKAFDESGIFVRVADIDHPQWQIKFSDTQQLQRYFEILQQFLDGVLRPETQPATQTEDKDYLCPHCGATRYADASACWACHRQYDGDTAKNS